ncbi:FGGY-family carbohydrate kinase [Salinibacterium sp. NYA9b]
MRMLLGIDVGTASSKGVLTDESGRIVATASVPHGVDTPRPGHFEQDADAVWWGDLVALCQELIVGIDPGDIVGMAVSAIGPCVLPLDADDQPLRPGILYGIDSRAVVECRELEASLSVQGLDVSLTSQSVVPKLLWLQKNEPEVWAATRSIVGAEAYLVLRLTGQRTLDSYLSTNYSPLVSADGRSWLPGFESICPADLLPRLVWSTDVVGSITADAALRTGLAVGTPVVAGTADAAAEATSAGLAAPGDLMLMYGSTGFFILQCESVPSTTSFWPGHFLEEGTFSLAGGTNNLGNVTAWFRDEFGSAEVAEEQNAGIPSFAALAELAAGSTPGAHGIIALPYLSGERTPIDDPLARGVIFGLTLQHTRGDIYRALLEGIAFSIRENLDKMAAEGYTASRVLAVGGGAQNELLLQIVSDVTGRAQSVPDETIGASLGDALRAGVGVGVFASLADAAETVRYSHTVAPNHSLAETYDAAYERYRRLYVTTRNLAHDLAGGR